MTVFPRPGPDDEFVPPTDAAVQVEATPEWRRIDLFGNRDIGRVSVGLGQMLAGPVIREPLARTCQGKPTSGGTLNMRGNFIDVVGCVRWNPYIHPISTNVRLVVCHVPST